MKYLILIIATAISSVAVAQAFKKEVTICNGYNIQWQVPEKVYSISIQYKKPNGQIDDTYNLDVKPNYIFVVKSE